MESRASLIIQFEASGKMGMQFSGDESCMLGLLGTIDVVKANLVQRLQEKPQYNATWQEPTEPPTESVHVPIEAEDLPTAKHTHYSSELEVPRNAALAEYYKAFDILRERINVISQAKEGSLWVINPEAIASL